MSEQFSRPQDVQMGDHLFNYLVFHMYFSEVWIIAFAKLEVLVHSLCRELHLPHINSRTMNNLRLFVRREEDEVIRTWN